MHGPVRTRQIDGYTACILKEARKKSDLQREIELFRARYRESVHVYITCGFSDIQQRQKGAGLSLRTNSCIDKIARFFFSISCFFVSRSRCIGKLIRCECRLFLFPDVSHGSSAARQAMNFTSEKNCTVPGELNANFRVLSLADRVSELLGEFRIGGETFRSFVQLMNAFFCFKIVLYFGHFIYKTGSIVHRSLGAI